MQYTNQTLAKIKSKVLSKINAELSLAIDNDELDEFLEKYGIIIEESETMFVNTRTMKILVLGDLAGSINSYKLTLKKCGIDERNVIFENDYDKIKRIGVARLEYSTEYSDIIVGPIAHKISGIGDNSSFLALVEKEPNKFPRVVKATANNTIKLSITSFKDSLLKTRFFEALNY